MADTEQGGGHKRASSAPYVGYLSYKNMLGGFKEHVLPGRIDRSVLSNFSGIVISQLLNTLRFFDQIDGEGKPKASLERMLAAYGGDVWPATLAQELKRAYAPIFELDLNSASPAQFTEKFRATYPAEGDTLRKALTFFLNAAREAQIPINNYILKNKKPRSSSNGTRRTRPPKPGSTASGQTGSPETPKPLNGGGSSGGGASGSDDFMRELLAKFPAFDASWPDNIKSEWFKGFEQFMQRAQKK